MRYLMRWIIVISAVLLNAAASALDQSAPFGFSWGPVIYKDENIKVTAIENHHFHFPKDSPPYGKTMSLSYRIETPDRVIVITGDTGAFDGLAEFARTADLFVTEVIDPDEVLEFLSNAFDPDPTRTGLKSRSAAGS